MFNLFMLQHLTKVYPPSRHVSNRVYLGYTGNHYLLLEPKVLLDSDAELRVSKRSIRYQKNLLLYLTNPKRAETANAMDERTQFAFILTYSFYYIS